MKKLSLKQSTMLLIAIISLIVVGILVFVIIPSINEIKALQKDIAQTQEELEIRYQRTKKLKRSLSELNEVKTKVEKFKQIKIKVGNELAIITELENIAESHNLEQNLNVSFKDGAYKFSFLNHGVLQDHINFLKTLEQLPYYMVINRIQWEKRSGDGQTDPRITTSFDATIYAD